MPTETTNEEAASERACHAFATSIEERTFAATANI